MTGPRRGKPIQVSQTFVIPYSSVQTHAGEFLRPLVGGRLTWQRGAWEGSLLVDTGADHSFVPKRIAKGLHLAVRPPVHPITSAGAEFEAMESQVYLQITDADTHGSRGRPFLLSPVLVPKEEGILEEPVLGQVLFMDRYEVTLRRSEREFVLREV